MKRAQAVSYLRVSTAQQLDGDGMERQRQEIARYAQAARLSVVEEYRDEGVSGTKDMGARPGLTALMEKVVTSGISTVVVERADRLARDLMVSELILAEFRRAGVSIVDTSGNDLTADDDPTRVLVRQVLAAVAQFDKSILVRKLRSARDRMAKRIGRRPEGRKAFGAKTGEQATIDRAKELLAQHRQGVRPAYAKVAHQLNGEGRKTRTGVPWSGPMVRRVVSRG